MGIACETSPWCLGLGPSYWCGDMVEWSVQSLVLTPPSPYFPAGSVSGVSMGKVGDSLGMKVGRSADTMGLVPSASPSPGRRGYGHNRIRPEAARVRLMVQQDLPDPFRMLNYA